MKLPKITFVDDEADILENFASLYADNYNVVTFHGSQAFLDALGTPLLEDLRLVISDFKMPGKDGLRMIQEAQQKRGSFPFIILSGHLDKQTVLNAVQMGVFRLLEKPVDFDLLQESIEQLLVEHDMVHIRGEIRNLTAQLRELYSGMRLVFSQHVPQPVLDRMVLDASQGEEKKKMSFEQLLEMLEGRLDRLLESEKILNQLKQR